MRGHYGDMARRCEALEREVERLRAALIDAIRSPMGVVPDSAMPYYRQIEMEEEGVWCTRCGGSRIDQTLPCTCPAEGGEEEEE